MHAVRKIEGERKHSAQAVGAAAVAAGGPVAALHADLAARLEAGTLTRWTVAEQPFDGPDFATIRLRGLALAGGLATGAILLALFLA